VKTTGQRWEALIMHPLRERPSLVISTHLPESPHQRTAASALLTDKASTGMSIFLHTRYSEDSLRCHRKTSHPTSISYWPVYCLEGQFHWARKNWGSWLQQKSLVFSTHWGVQLHGLQWLEALLIHIVINKTIKSYEKACLLTAHHHVVKVEGFHCLKSCVSELRWCSCQNWKISFTLVVDKPRKASGRSAWFD